MKNQKVDHLVIPQAQQFQNFMETLPILINIQLLYHPISLKKYHTKKHHKKSKKSTKMGKLSVAEATN
jgi:hypothetical protein